MKRMTVKDLRKILKHQPEDAVLVMEHGAQDSLLLGCYQRQTACEIWRQPREHSGQPT